METKQTMNWFALASVPLYLGAGITAFLRGNWPMAGVWSCYAIANAFLVYSEVRMGR
jgi:hypothetical protein